MIHDFIAGSRGRRFSFRDAKFLPWPGFASINHRVNERERETDRQTDRQTDRDRERQTDRNRDRQTD